MHETHFLLHFPSNCRIDPPVRVIPCFEFYGLSVYGDFGFYLFLVLFGHYTCPFACVMLQDCVLGLKEYHQVEMTLNFEWTKSTD